MWTRRTPSARTSEVCTFCFDGVNRVGGSGQAFGDIRYRPNASVVYEAFFTFLDHEFRADDWSDVAVVPMRPNRPSGC